jgi:hypothetical protein
MVWEMSGNQSMNVIKSKPGCTIENNLLVRAGLEYLKQ